MREGPLTSAVSARVQSLFQFGLIHPGTPWDVSAARFSIKLRSGLLVAPGASASVFSSGATAFAPLSAPQIFPIRLFGFILGGAGLAQSDRNRLLRILHLAAAGRLELAVFEFVHNTSDGFFLCLRLMSCHGSTQYMSDQFRDRFWTTFGSTATLESFYELRLRRLSESRGYDWCT
jgi:hypothetical protein